MAGVQAHHGLATQTIGKRRHLAQGKLVGDACTLPRRLRPLPPPPLPLPPPPLPPPPPPPCLNLGAGRCRRCTVAAVVTAAIVSMLPLLSLLPPTCGSSVAKFCSRQFSTWCPVLTGQRPQATRCLHNLIHASDADAQRTSGLHLPVCILW